MTFKLFIVSIALGIWKGAVRLSDKLSTNQWIILCCINFALLLGFYFFYQSPDTTNYSSINRDHSIIYYDLSDSKGGASLTSQLIKNNITRSEIINSMERFNNPTVFYFSGHGSVLPDDVASIDSKNMTNSPKPTHYALTVGSSNWSDDFSVNWVVQNQGSTEISLDSWITEVVIAHEFAHASGVLVSAEDSGFLQDNNLPTLFNRFIPNFSPSYKIYPVQNEDSYLRQAVFYAPLALCVLQLFSTLMALISLHRRWAEGIQLKLTNEKLNLEIEKLKEERDKEKQDKEKPKIIISK